MIDFFHFKDNGVIMKLPKQGVPLEFLKALPEGIKFVNKQSKDFLIVDHICCPNGHKLNTDNVRIHGEPAIKIAVKIGSTEGIVFLDPFWGGHNKLYNFVPDIVSSKGIAEVFCPICNVSMTVDLPCKICSSSKHIVFTLPDHNNKIYVCAKLGCAGHKMEITKIPEPVSDIVNDINYFGEQEETDIFEGL